MHDSVSRRSGATGSLRSAVCAAAMAVLLALAGAGAALAEEGDPPPPAQDTTPPVIRFIQPEPGHAFNTPQTLDFTVTDDIDPSPVVDSNYPLGHVFSEEGTYELAVTATDASGNRASASLTFIVDFTRPLTAVEVSGTSGREGWYTTPVVLTARSTDDLAGVHHNEYFFGMGWRWGDTVFQDDGQRWIVMRGVDWAHNTALPVWTLVKVDTRHPEVTCTLDGPSGLDGWFVGPVTATIGVSDGGSGPAEAEYATGGDAWTRYEGGLSLGGEGTTVLSVRGCDVAGNVTEPEPMKVRIDSSAPEISGDIPAEGAWYGYGSGFALSFRADDAVSGVACCTATLDGEEVASGTTLSMTEPGAHRLVISATDRAGNVRRIVRDFRVVFAAGEWLPPVSLSKTWTRGRSLPLKFTVLDHAGVPTGAARALVEVRIGGELVETGEAVAVSDPDGGARYQYDLKTAERRAGTYDITVRLNDGVTVMSVMVDVG